MPSAGIHSDHHLCGLSTLASRARAHLRACERRSGRMTPMKLPRRDFLHLAAGAAVLPAVSRIAWAQTYPSQPVRIIVGLPAGAATDILARFVGQLLSERLGKQFIVENRPGAAGNIATELVTRASPDGYTLLQVNSGNAVNASLYANLNFNFIRDITPVACIARTPFVMVVNPSSPAKTVPEFIAYAKANPGKINMDSPGIGSANHIFGASFAMMAGMFTCRIAAISWPICSVGGCRSYSVQWLSLSSTSETASCAASQ